MRCEHIFRQPEFFDARTADAGAIAKFVGHAREQFCRNFLMRAPALALVSDRTAEQTIVRLAA
jgi:hypothetical protein